MQNSYNKISIDNKIIFRKASDKKYIFYNLILFYIQIENKLPNFDFLMGLSLRFRKVITKYNTAHNTEMFLI